MLFLRMYLVTRLSLRVLIFVCRMWEVKLQNLAICQDYTPWSWLWVMLYFQIHFHGKLQIFFWDFLIMDLLQAQQRINTYMHQNQRLRFVFLSCQILYLLESRKTFSSWIWCLNMWGCFHIHTVHLDIIKVFLFTNWCTSELS